MRERTTPGLYFGARGSQYRLEKPECCRWLCPRAMRLRPQQERLLAGSGGWTACSALAGAVLVSEKLVWTRRVEVVSWRRLRVSMTMPSTTGVRFRRAKGFWACWTVTVLAVRTKGFLGGSWDRGLPGGHRARGGSERERIGGLQFLWPGWLRCRVGLHQKRLFHRDG